MVQKNVVRTILLALAGIWPLAAQGQTPLVFNVASRAPYVTQDRKGFLDLLVAEMFRRVGEMAEMTVYPNASARALALANQGRDDGVALRVKGLEKKYPNLVIIPESILKNYFVAYAKRSDIKVSGFAALKSYSVGHIIGWRLFEVKLKEFGFETVTRVKNGEQLFSLLENDRVDVVLYERWLGLALAKRRKIKIHTLGPPLAQPEMFLYLHVRHKALIGKAAQALAAMKHDGSYKSIVDRTLTPLLQ
jgi:polar amino acid transport system substrate-binding protein